MVLRCFFASSEHGVSFWRSGVRVNSRLNVAALSAATLLFAGACSGEQGKVVDSEAPATAIVYEATSTQGETVSLVSLRGEAVLLNAWATWCGPCRLEIPYFAKLHDARSVDGLHVVGVSIDAADDRQKVLDLAPSLGLSYDIWLDPEQRITTILGGSSVPATLLIDRTGHVVWKHLGPVDETTPGFHDALERVLASKL